MCTHVSIYRYGDVSSRPVFGMLAGNLFFYFTSFLFKLVLSSFLSFCTPLISLVSLLPSILLLPSLFRSCHPFHPNCREFVQSNCRRLAIDNRNGYRHLILHSNDSNNNNTIANRPVPHHHSEYLNKTTAHHHLYREVVAVAQQTVSGRH